MSLDFPLCTEYEPQSIPADDLFESSSVIDLLQSSQDVSMYYMSDDETLLLPSSLPPHSSPTMTIPQSSSMELLDFLNRDTLNMSNLQSTMAKTVTDVTYVSQYTSPILSQTTADDVFLPPLPITATSHIFAKPPLPSGNVKVSPRPSIKMTNQLVINPFVQPVSQRQFVRNPFALVTRALSGRARNTYARTSTRNSLTRTHNLHSIVKTPTRFTLVRSTRGPLAASKTQGIILVNPSQSAFVPAATRSVFVRSAAVTHTTTQNSNIVTESPVALTTESIICTKSTEMQIIQPESPNSCKTTSINPYIMNRTQSSVIRETQECATNAHSKYTSTITAYTITKARSTGTLSATQTQAAADGIRTSSTATPHTPLLVSAIPGATTVALKSTWISDRSSTLSTECPNHNAYAIAACTPATTADTTSRPRTRLIIPVTMTQFVTSSVSIMTTSQVASSNTATTPRVALTIRPTQNTYVTNVHTHSTLTTASTTTAAARGLIAVTTTPSAYTVTTSSAYTASRVACMRGTRARSVAVTTSSQTFTISDGFGSYTTLTISSDLKPTTRSQLLSSPTQSAYDIAAGVSSYPSSVTASDALARSRSQIIIPIGSNTATTSGVSYIVASTIASNTAATRNSSTAITKVASTTTAGISTHSLPTIRPDTLNITRNRLIIPVAQNAYSTADGLSSLTSTTVTTDSNRNRGPMTITTSQIASALMRDSLNMSMTTASGATAIRLPFTISATQSAYTITTGGSPCKSPINISDRMTRSRSATTIPTASVASATSDGISSNAVFTISSNVTTTTRSSLSAVQAQNVNSISHTSSTTASEVTARPLSRVVIPIVPNINATSTSPVSTTAFNVTTRSPFSPTQSAYIITRSVAPHTSSANLSDGSTKPQHRLVIPIIHNSGIAAVATNPTVTTSTVGTVTTTSIRSFPIASTQYAAITAGGSSISSTMTTDTIPRLRNRLIVPVVTNPSANTELSPVVTTPITAYTITRSRAGLPLVTTQSAYCITVPGNTFSTARPSEVLTRTVSPSAISGTQTAATAASSSFTTTTFALTTTTIARSTVALTPGDSPSTTVSCSVTTATPSLTSSGHRYVIKLTTTQNVLANFTNSSTVTTAVTTPITTTVYSPPEHQFLEPRPVQKLRTFPGPRTYAVAQRSSTGNIQQRPPVRNVTSRPPTKRVVTQPAPLQIFADVVCPPTSAQNQTTSTVTSVQSQPRFTLSHSSGTSTLIVPQYKNTVFKNLSTIAHPNPERINTRLLTPHGSAERFVIKRPVAYFPSKRTAHSDQTANQSTPLRAPSRHLRFTYGDVRLQTSRDDVSPHSAATTAESAVSQSAPSATIANTSPSTINNAPAQNCDINQNNSNTK